MGKEDREDPMIIECRVDRPEVASATKMGGFNIKGVEKEHEEVVQVGEVILTRSEMVEINKSVVLGTKLAGVEVLTVETLKEQQIPKANVEFSPMNRRSNEKQIC
jgi:hypothetical protein